VFIDDNPVELEIIQQQLPEVTLVQAPREAADLPGLLSRRGYFDHVIFSEEDRRRGEWYQAQAQRAQFARSSGDIESFYRSLAMRLTVLEVGDAELARVAQLTQRTNQFNMTTRRYSEADIRRFLGSSDHVVRAYRLEDRFGDNGVIGVVIMERAGDVCRLDTFLMSCRVIGRTVETAIVALIAEEARARQAVAVIGEFLPTKKNAPAREVYPKLGFGKVAESETCITWRLDLAGPRLDVPGWFEVLGAPVKS
jgi:FkbH-like protein